jgi:hypothetical protein
MIYEPFGLSIGTLKALCSSKTSSEDGKERGQMVSKALILTDDGKWVELTNCIIVGAVEEPDQVVYHKYLFSNGEIETCREMVIRAERYAAEMKKEIP